MSQRGSTWCVSWTLNFAARKKQLRDADTASRMPLHAQASEEDQGLSLIGFLLPMKTATRIMTWI